MNDLSLNTAVHVFGVQGRSRIYQQFENFARKTFHTEITNKNRK